MGLMPEGIREHGIFGGLGGGGGSAALYPSPHPPVADTPPPPQQPPLLAPQLPSQPQMRPPPNQTMGGLPLGNGAIIPGQSDPHKPGFDPKSVPFRMADAPLPPARQVAETGADTSLWPKPDESRDQF